MLLALVVIIALALLARSSGKDYLTLAGLQQQQTALSSYVQSRPLLSAALFCVTYILTTALSIPGATVLTLGGGALFGVVVGTLLVSFSSTVGASCALLFSRYLLRDRVRGWFGDRMAPIDRGIEREGAFYLLGVRLAPVFPFFLINLAVGLTRMRLWTFVWVSWLGMLPATIIYVNAGTQLSRLRSVNDVLSWNIAVALTLLGILPLIAKWILTVVRNRKRMATFRRPTRFDFNVVVIGGGAAGLVSSYTAAALKAKVALIERNRMGGDCLNTGCVPSKALLRSAKFLHQVRESERFGFSVEHPKADLSRIMHRVQSMIRRIEPHDSVERYEGLGVECIKGDAKILSPYEVEVDGRVLTTRSIIVATGGEPTIPQIAGIETTEFLTSETIWKLEELPERLVILGAGPIGVEMAQAFARLGSKVTVLERAPRILGREDREAAEYLAAALRHEGVEIVLNYEVTAIRDGKMVVGSVGAEVREVAFDKLLIALGRSGRGADLGLEALGVKVEKNGTVEHDESLRTEIPTIYVCGDVAGPYQLTHAASYQAVIAVTNALFSPLWSAKVNYRVMPRCVFTDPELAQVGLNEEEAVAAGAEFQTVRYGIDELDRAIVEGEAHGFVKVLTTGRSDRILGVTIVGPEAGELLSEFVLAMKHDLGMNKILGTIHTYPTLSEANRFAAGVWRRANTPPLAQRILAAFNGRRRGR